MSPKQANRRKSFWLGGLLLAAGALGGPSCESNDEGIEAQSLDGPAIMRVVNRTPDVLKVTFDRTYIGDVAANANRDWNVPAGTHFVDVYDFQPGDSTVAGEFYEGIVTEVIFRVNGPAAP